MRFTVYSKDNCKYCIQAKQLLQEFINKTYGHSKKDNPLLSIVYIGSEFTVDDLKKVFSDMGLLPPRTVPCIFYQEGKDSEKQYIGGYSELEPFLNRLKEGINASNEA